MHGYVAGQQDIHYTRESPWLASLGMCTAAPVLPCLLRRLYYLGHFVCGASNLPHLIQSWGLRPELENFKNVANNFYIYNSLEGAFITKSREVFATNDIIFIDAYRIATRKMLIPSAAAAKRASERRPLVSVVFDAPRFLTSRFPPFFLNELISAPPSYRKHRFDQRHHGPSHA